MIEGCGPTVGASAAFVGARDVRVAGRMDCDGLHDASSPLAGYPHSAASPLRQSGESPLASPITNSAGHYEVIRMPTVPDLVKLLEAGARRLATEAARARRAGAQAEHLKGQADAFLLLAEELRERGDPVALLEAMFDMERAAVWTARLDEEHAAEFEAQGNLSASRYHARSARYSHGLIEGYRQARLLLGSASAYGDQLNGMHS